MDMESHTRTRNRGFASMDQHRQKEIARKGGRAAHEKGKAHEFTPDEARAAGRKGGEKVSLNRKHMAEIGRRGGRSSAQRRRPGAPSPGVSPGNNGNGGMNDGGATEQISGTGAETSSAIADERQMNAVGQSDFGRSQGSESSASSGARASDDSDEMGEENI